MSVEKLRSRDEMFTKELSNDLPTRSLRKRKIKEAVREKVRDTDGEGFHTFFEQNFKISADPINKSAQKRMVVLMSGDFLAIATSLIISFCVASFARSFTLTNNLTLESLLSPWLITTLFIMPLALVLSLSLKNGHYNRFKPFWSEVLEVVKICVVAFSISLVVLFLAKEHISRLWFSGLWLLIPVSIPVFRLLSRKLMVTVGYWYRPLVVVGVGENAVAAAKMIGDEPFLGKQVVGFIRPPKYNGDVRVPQLEVFDTQTLSDIEASFKRPEILFALDTAEELEQHTQLIEDYAWNTDRISVAPPIGGVSFYGAEVMRVFRHDNLVLNLNFLLGRFPAQLTKRVFDIFISALLILLFSPVFIILFLLVKGDGGPAFYQARRLGYKGRDIKILKFRSMAVNAEERLHSLLRSDPEFKKRWDESLKLADDPRITALGKILRKTSLDELPQLFNVLLGDMSLVGPRPVEKYEANLYRKNHPDSYRFLLLVRPGITGLWQVCGRNDLSHKERAELNLWYVRNWSIWIDIVILLKTAPAAMKGV